jgi:PPP family 3-phenylpropionic acid transporter
VGLYPRRGRGHDRARVPGGHENAQRSQRLPYARLSTFYFFYFASLGALIPYWGPYLQGLGLGPEQIGQLMASIMATKVVAPYVWGWIADHGGGRLRIIRLASFAATGVFAAALVVKDFWGMLLVLALFSFFWNAALPQFEATTLNHLGEDTHRYARIRLWGSIGFILSVTALAPVLEHIGLDALPGILLGLLGCIALSTLAVWDRPSTTPPQVRDAVLSVLRRPAVWSLLVACFLAQASHGPYYAFFTIYLGDHGYSAGAIGAIWALGVVAEIVLFWFMHRLLLRFPAKNLLMVAVLVTGLRWWLIGAYVDHLGLLLFAQLLHAASFGLFHASAIHLVHGLFPGRLQGRGQALYSSLSFGLGGAVGSLASGYIWTRLGAQWIYYLAAVLALAGFLAAWWGVGREGTQGVAAEESETWEGWP